MKPLLIFTIILILFSCKNEPSKENKPTTLNIDTDSVTSTQPEEEEEEEEEEEVESRYHYDQDWEIFKTAVLTKDIKGMAAFASSDNIDSEALLQDLSKGDLIKTLELTTYDDLDTEIQRDFTLIVFSAKTVKEDKTPNEISLYFTQGEPSLLLDYYISIDN